MDIVTLSIGFMVGMLVMAAIFAVGSSVIVARKSGTTAPDPIRRKIVTSALVALMLGAFAFSQVVISYAQTAVPLEIPTDVIFTQTNSWMETFAPIAAIGIGISIALAVLGYLGKMIKSAFN